MVGCLQVQSVETIRVPADVEPEEGGEQVSIFCDYLDFFDGMFRISAVH
jgi:hypothetical protein